MYTINTILKRNEPLGSEKEPNALDVIKIVGVSPIKQSSVEEWSGVGGDQLIVQPVEEFGANQIVPVAALQEAYTVAVPGDDVPAEKVIDTRPPERPVLLSPEAQFAKIARDGTKPATSPRKRTPVA